MIAVLFLILCADIVLAQEQVQDACVDVVENEHIQLVLDLEEVLIASSADMAQCIATDLLAPPTGTCTLGDNQILIAKNTVGYGLSVRSSDGIVRAFWARWSDAGVTATILTPMSADRHDVAAQQEVLDFVHGLITPHAELAKSN